MKRGTVVMEARNVGGGRQGRLGGRVGEEEEGVEGAREGICETV